MKLDKEKAESARKELFDYIAKLEASGRIVKPHSEINPKVQMKIGTRQTKISVVPIDVISATIQAKKNNPNAKIAILNFASYKNPGGGFMGNSYAQEEAICYCTNLYQELCRNRGWYSNHYKLNNGLYENESILSHNITVVAYQLGKLLKPDDVFYIDVLTCAAPNATSILRYKPQLINTIAPASRERTIYATNILTSMEYDIVILGAFGCGVFKNDPKVVADAFKEALSKNYGNFEQVVFAIPDESSNNFKAFKETFPMQEGK